MNDDDLNPFLTALRQRFGDSEFTAAEVLAAVPDDLLPRLIRRERDYPSRPPQNLNRVLGRWLVNQLGETRGEYVLHKTRKLQNLQRWRFCDPEAPIHALRRTIPGATLTIRTGG